MRGPSATGMRQPAILGGAPAFERVLHVGRPNIGDRAGLHQALDDILDRRWLTNGGPVLEAFEARLAEYLGVTHVVAMCNATVALEIVIRALGLHGEVIVPAYTFVATPHALQWQEITPVFADVDPLTHNLDPAAVERMITPRTTGIIGVHVWGRPCDVTGLEAVATKHGLALFFDAAHGFGCSAGGRMLGGFGAAEVFSFHATKFFNTFEGGAIATNDKSLADKARLMQNFGFSGLDSVIYIGINGKMSEISAAMGMCGLDALDGIVEANRRNHARYAMALSGLRGLQLVDYDRAERQNYQYVVVEVDEATTGLSRDALVDVLQADNIRARRYFFPGCHRMEPYGSLYPHAGLLLPHTERLCGTVLQLPTGTQLDEHDVDQICAVLAGALARPGDIKARLASGA